jgi:hypothetical protein
VKGVLAEASEVRDLLRDLIRQVHYHPLAVQGSYRLEIRGDLAVLIDDKKPGLVSEAGLMLTLGAGTRTHLKLHLTSDHLAVFVGQALAPKIGPFRAAA